MFHKPKGHCLSDNDLPLSLPHCWINMAPEFKYWSYFNHWLCYLWVETNHMQIHWLGQLYPLMFKSRIIVEFWISCVINQKVIVWMMGVLMKMKIWLVTMAPEFKAFMHSITDCVIYELRQMTLNYNLYFIRISDEIYIAPSGVQKERIKVMVMWCHFPHNHTKLSN